MRPLRLAFAIGLLTGAPLLAGQKQPPIPPELVPQSREAQEQFEQGDYVRAEIGFRKLVKQAPENVRLMGNLAVTLFRLGKYTEASEQLKKSLTLFPEDPWAYRVLGIVYYAKGEHELARLSLEEAIRINPKDATAHNYYGINASQMGHNAKAIEELKTAIANDGSYSDAYFNLALVFLIQRKPDPEVARDYYERALKLGATPDVAMEKLLGWVDANGLRTAGNPLTPEVVDKLRDLLLARR